MIKKSQKLRGWLAMRLVDADKIEKILEGWLESLPNGEETPAIEACLNVNVIKNAPTFILKGDSE